MRLDTEYAFEMFLIKFEYSSGKLTNLSSRYSIKSCSNAPFLDFIPADIKSFISISPFMSCNTVVLSFLHARKTRFWKCVDWGKISSFLKTHSGEKSNKCNQCDFASSRAGDLRRHLKTHIIGEKSNKCNQCDFASTQAGDLRRHLKTHSGDKSNKCNQCNFASTWPADLRIHFKSHSGEKSIDAASVIMHPLKQATLGTT